MEKYYKRSEVLKIASISASTFYRHMNEGKLVAVKIGSHWKVSETELKKYLKGDN